MPRQKEPPKVKYEIRYNGNPIPPRKLLCTKAGGEQFTEYHKFVFDDLETALRRFSYENGWHCHFEWNGGERVKGGRFGLQIWKGPGGKRSKRIAEIVPYKDPERWEFYRVRFYTTPAETAEVYDLVKSGKVRWWTD